MTEASDVGNGTVWVSPSWVRAFVLYVGGLGDADRWMLVAAHFHTSVPPLPTTDPDGSGRMFYTREDLARRLQDNGWRRDGTLFPVLFRRLKRDWRQD